MISTLSCDFRRPVRLLALGLALFWAGCSGDTGDEQDVADGDGLLPETELASPSAPNVNEEEGAPGDAPGTAHGAAPVDPSVDNEAALGTLEQALTTSFTRTCNNIDAGSLGGLRYISASCLRRNGSRVRSTIFSPQLCTTDISNCDGQLRCGC